MSIPSNIAEGHSLQTSGAARRHFRIARASTAELETQVLLSVELGFVHAEAAAKVLLLCSQISRMLVGLIRTTP